MYKNFSISIGSQEKVAIIGRSGSGKSTLAKLLSGIYKPTRGQILLGGVDTKEIATSHIRKNVNYINQKTGLFNDTVIQNMKYGNNACDATIVSLLQKYQLLEIFNKIEKGVYGNTGINGGNLSLGMQKIAMLIRGLLKPCEIVILDEPLAALDTKTREKVIQLIQGVCKEKTVIICRELSILMKLNFKKKPIQGW
jgi:ATP-binding cassette subfamily B protein